MKIIIKILVVHFAISIFLFFIFLFWRRIEKFLLFFFTVWVWIIFLKIILILLQIIFFYLRRLRSLFLLFSFFLNFYFIFRLFFLIKNCALNIIFCFLKLLSIQKRKFMIWIYHLLLRLIRLWIDTTWNRLLRNIFICQTLNIILILNILIIRQNRINLSVILIIRFKQHAFLICRHVTFFSYTIY